MEFLWLMLSCFPLTCLTDEVMFEDQIIQDYDQEFQILQTVRETRTNFSGIFKERYSALENLHETYEPDAKLSKELSFETAWTKSGKRKLTLVNVNTGNASSESFFPQEPVDDSDDVPSVLKRRSRRELFGRHRRYYIPTRSFAQKFPFEVVVRISTGCTGTLVSPRHVLTAAHCLHNGKDYNKGFHSLRVGLLLPNKTLNWIGATHTKLPLAWVQGNDTDASRFDYAIIKLERRHKRRFMSLSYSQGNRYGRMTKIHFTAFEDDKPLNTIWYRACYVLAATGNMMFHCCDAQPGSSGAGIYVYHFDRESGKQDRRVVGVFSGNRNVPYHPWWPYVGCPPIWRGNFNAAIRINLLKFKQICSWIGLRHADKECKSFLERRQPARDPTKRLQNRRNPSKNNNRKRRNREANKKGKKRSQKKKKKKKNRGKKSGRSSKRP